jgi:hypothetical protein
VTPASPGLCSCAWSRSPSCCLWCTAVQVGRSSRQAGRQAGRQVGYRGYYILYIVLHSTHLHCSIRNPRPISVNCSPQQLASQPARCSLRLGTREKEDDGDGDLGRFTHRLHPLPCAMPAGMTGVPWKRSSKGPSVLWAPPPKPRLLFLVLVG